MGNIFADLPELQTAANSITGYIEDFRSQKDQVMQASEDLSEGWEGDAAQKYLETMSDFTNWMEQMAGVLDGYPEALHEIEAKYREADADGARAFGGR